MPLETWLAYTLVTTTFLLIPGPTIILVISYSLLRGRQAVIALVLGVGLGDLTAISLSFLGVGCRNCILFNQMAGSSIFDLVGN